VNLISISKRRQGLGAWQPLRDVSVVAIAATLALAARSADAASTPFATMQAPFTQTLYAVRQGPPGGNNVLGGITFDPSSGTLFGAWDVFAGGPVTAFNGSVTENGGTFVTGVELPNSQAGLGLLYYKDGTLYSNTINGVANLDPVTGVLLRTIGTPGNALGIAVDPITQHIVYVANPCCTLTDVDPTAPTGNPTTWGVVAGSTKVDGIAFDPLGQWLFLSTVLPTSSMTVYHRGVGVQASFPVPGGPDGIAFHATAPAFVVTNNNDGTMTRFDFPNNDYTQAPTASLFASGGFRGDHTVVGADGCLYATQEGARYPDGTVTGENSVVQICPGFAPTQPTPGLSRNGMLAVLAGLSAIGAFFAVRRRNGAATQLA